ncbi:MAG: 50S ribosomal protein L22 [Deltaproteobacteria bacterium]|nr:50S ribosomal protein L22 [Deltaproteobacteria bacterium]
MAATRAILRFGRIAPRKVNNTAQLVRGKKVEEALAILRWTHTSAAPVLSKLIRSAVANAENKGNVDIDNLYVKVLDIGGGPILYRHRPSMRGRALPIKKRTTHITVTLEEI